MSQPFEISLKAARVNCGYTQSSLAKKLGVTKRTIGSWEKGQREVKPYALYAMAYIFQMDAEQICLPDFEQEVKSKL
ncbi:helix-turn-helix transcriptional regulator [Halobacillus halophilus]|uniref:helix-turn-helix transcriptional regulator n=1 Tax=Halobacillus halophilus TaxID=1570 RepID=UPI001CD3F17C|nr:helix-turn-helix transcriptional regulator [Halobacillus halophilus]MCA1012794.1 helix-turn-helix domain-containing protein [Halobacillus halophilus]